MRDGAGGRAGLSQSPRSTSGANRRISTGRLADVAVLPLHTRSHSQSSAWDHADPATSSVRLHLAETSAHWFVPASSAVAIVARPARSKIAATICFSKSDVPAGLPVAWAALIVRLAHALPTTASHRLESSRNCSIFGRGSPAATALSAPAAARSPYSEDKRGGIGIGHRGSVHQTRDSIAGVAYPRPTRGSGSRSALTHSRRARSMPRRNPNPAVVVSVRCTSRAPPRAGFVSRATTRSP